MSEAAAKTAGKAQSSSVERRPQRPALGPERTSAVDAMRVLHDRAGNRAMTQAIGGGLPLPAHIRREMESRFGAEFGDVRVHDDASAHARAAALNAKAYTHGVHIVFSRDTFAPERREGRQLLAHELAHVVQQRRGGAAQPRQDGRGALEADARRAADTVVNGSGAVAVAGASAPGLASEPEDEKKKPKKAKPAKSKKPYSRASNDIPNLEDPGRRDDFNAIIAQRGFEVGVGASQQELPAKQAQENKDRGEPKGGHRRIQQNRPTSDAQNKANIEARVKVPRQELETIEARIAANKAEADALRRKKRNKAGLQPDEQSRLEELNTQLETDRARSRKFSSYIKQQESRTTDAALKKAAARQAVSSHYDPAHPDQPSKGGFLGPSGDTHVVIRVIDSKGRTVARVYGKFDAEANKDKNPAFQRHAEQNAMAEVIRQLDAELGPKRKQGEKLRGYRIEVVGDREVCEEKCAPTLSRFAQRNNIDRVDGFTFVSTQKNGRRLWDKATATHAGLASSEGAEPLRLQHIPIYQRPGESGSSGGHSDHKPPPQDPPAHGAKTADAKKTATGRTTRPPPAKSAARKSATPKSATPKSATPKSTTPKSATPKPPARSRKGSQVDEGPAYTTPRVARPRKAATAKAEPLLDAATPPPKPAVAAKRVTRATKPPGVAGPAGQTPSPGEPPKFVAGSSKPAAPVKPPANRRSAAAARPALGKPAPAKSADTAAPLAPANSAAGGPAIATAKPARKVRQSAGAPKGADVVTQTLPKPTTRARAAVPAKPPGVATRPLAPAKPADIAAKPPAAAKPAGVAAKPGAPSLKSGPAAKPPGKPIQAAAPGVPTAPKSAAPKPAAPKPLQSGSPKPSNTPKRPVAGRPVAPTAAGKPGAAAAIKPRTAPKPAVGAARPIAPRPAGMAGASTGRPQAKGASIPVRPPAKPGTPSAPAKPSIGAPPAGVGKITDREISRQLIAGRGKFGVGGGVSIAQQQQHANGVTTTHSAAFGGKAWVETTEDLGSNPKRYRVTFHVNLSAQGSAEAKHQRGVSGSVSAGGSLELTKSRLLLADEKQRYLDAVNSSVSAGYQELRVAELAAQGSIEEAKALLMEIKGAVGKPDPLAGMQEGDDVTIEASGVIGGDLGLSRGPVAVHGGVSKSGTLIFSKSLHGGRIIISVTSAEGTEKKGGGGINVSGIGMDVTKSADSHSSESYTFVLDATDPERNARYGKILAARSMADLAALRAADHGLLSWHSTSAGSGGGVKTTATAGADDASASISVGGHHDLTHQTIEGPDGETKIWTGTSDGGGSIAVGRKTIVSGDRTDEFTGGAGPDNKGFGEVSSTKRDSHPFVALKKLISGGDKPVGTAAGVATRDEETATTTNKEGAALTDDSYSRLDAIASAGLKAWASHWNGNLATREAWIKAWPKVVAAHGNRQLIAKAMGEFQDAATRGGAETVRNAIEGTAIAFEFPEGLLPMKPLYDSLVVQDPILEAEAESSDAAALSKLNDALSRLSAMSEKLNQHAGDFQRPADYIEMRQRIDARVAAVRAEIARRNAPAKNPGVPAGAGKDKSPPQQKSADATAAKPEVRSDAGQDSGKEQAANDPAVVQTKIVATIGRLNSYRVIEQKTFAEMEEELNSFFGPSVIDLINIERKLKEAYPKWDTDVTSLRELYKQAGDTDDVAASKTVPFKPNRQRYLDLDSRVPYRGMGSGLPGYKEI